MGQEWVDVLTKDLSSERFLRLMTSISNAYSDPEIKIYPEDKNDLFRALRLTSPNNIKVVILGQDPYPDSNANGLAFSCKHKLSYSLENIFKALRKESYNNTYDFTQIDLERWAKQGVLLLNTSLIVGVNYQDNKRVVSYSHLDWQAIVQPILNQAAKQNAIFCLWGSEANQYLEMALAKECLPLTYIHPAAVKHFKDDQVKVWNCNHFTIVNRVLARRKDTEIVW